MFSFGMFKYETHRNPPEGDRAAKRHIETRKEAEAKCREKKKRPTVERGEEKQKP